MKLSVLFISLLLVPFFVYGADTLYVQSYKAKLLAEPSFKSETVLVAIKGEQMQIIVDADHWYKAVYKGKTGWISKLLVSTQPPKDRKSLLSKYNTKYQKQSVRVRASSTATAAAARGLREDDRARLSDTEQENYSALKKVESVKLDESEVIKFNSEAEQE